MAPLEFKITEIWLRLLGRDNIGRDDDFFDIGGDLTLATKMLLEVEQLTGLVLPDMIRPGQTTVRSLAEVVARKVKEGDGGLLFRLQPGTGQAPFIFLDGDFWGGGFYARKIARLLGPEYPFYNLRSHGFYTDAIPTIEDMARDYMPLVIAAQPDGPYRLGGHCNGALIAWELARQLTAAGKRVEIVAMIAPITINARPSIRLAARALDRVVKLVGRDPERRAARMDRALSFIWQMIRWADSHWYGRGQKSSSGIEVLGVKIEQGDRETTARLVEHVEKYYQVMARYIPPPAGTDVLCLVSEYDSHRAAFAGDAWRNLTPNLEVAVVPGEHLTCITTHAEALVDRLRQRLMVVEGEIELAAAAA